MFVLIRRVAYVMMIGNALIWLNELMQSSEEKKAKKLEDENNVIRLEDYRQRKGA